MYMYGMGLGWLDGMLIKGQRQSKSTFGAYNVTSSTKDLSMADMSAAG